MVPGGGVALVRSIARTGLAHRRDRGRDYRRPHRAARLRGADASDRRQRRHEGAVVVEIVSEGEGAYGFNAQTEEYGDLVSMGVIDPTKVVRTALSNAASIATLLLTTDALVAEEPEEEEEEGHGHGHAHPH